MNRSKVLRDTGTVEAADALGTLTGELSWGLGYALMEQPVIEDGKVVTANFGDYKIPWIRDIPDLVTSVS